MSDFRKKYESFSTLTPLLDFSFNTFITLSVLKVFYVLIVGLQTIGLLLVIVGGFTQGVLAGLGGLVIAPFVWLVVVIMTRMYLEIIAVIFRIAHNTTMLAQSSETPRQAA